MKMKIGLRRLQLNETRRMQRNSDVYDNMHPANVKWRHVGDVSGDISDEK